MIKKSFFAKKPRFEYETIGTAPVAPERLPLPGEATLFLKASPEGKSKLRFKIGDRVKTGQKIQLFEDENRYVISSVTGAIASIMPYTGDFGQAFTAIKVTVDAEDEQDDAFAECGKDSPDELKAFLGNLPGNSELEKLFSSDVHVDTLVVCGVEKDLLIMTSQYVMKSKVKELNAGISILKKLTGVHKVVVAMPQALMTDAGAVGGASGVELRVIDTAYPAALPRMIMKDVMGQAVPANKTPDEMGVFFVGAEAVAAVGSAVLEGRIPVNKLFTLIDKNLNKTLVEARIGTPLKDVFDAFEISLFDRDRIIVGGPFTGAAVYAEDHPVGPDTDAVMVQDASAVPIVADTPCINCGECVRICPADIPVNMLIRFLEARQYEDAAAMYDLYSCVECGLCSFVCVSKIPIFQYIKLAKYELDRVRSEEEAEDV